MRRYPLSGRRGAAKGRLPAEATAQAGGEVENVKINLTFFRIRERNNTNMNHDEFNIREFKESDAKHVSVLIRRCWREMNLGDYTSEGIRQQIEETTPGNLIELSKNVTFFVAEREEDIVGFGGHDQELIRLLFVTPSYQCNGIGTSIVKKILSDARAKGIEKLECNSTLYAVPFYKSMGLLKRESLILKSFILREWQYISLKCIRDTDASLNRHTHP